jgi:DNA-binding MarR family transcriptional regulator
MPKAEISKPDMSKPETPAPDEIIHQPLRLRIMAALNAGNGSGQEFDFARLKAVTQASDGNLGSHIETLERARYVEVERGYRGRRPRMVVRPTPQGLRAYQEHVAFLRSIIEREVEQ